MADPCDVEAMVADFEQNVVREQLCFRCGRYQCFR